MSKAKGKPTAAVEEVAPEAVSGHGQFVLPDGSKYIGDYVDTAGVKVRQGHGTFTLGSESYTGEWTDDMMNGLGEYTFSSGAVYQGCFKDNLFEGEGTYRSSNGTIYSGHWRANKMHGEGTHTSADGLVTSGEFVNGIYVSGVKSTQPEPEAVCQE